MKKVLPVLLSLLCFGVNAQFKWAKKTNIIKASAVAVAQNGDFFVLSRPDTADIIYHLDSNAVLINSHTLPHGLGLVDLKINSDDQLIVAGSNSHTGKLGTLNFSHKGNGDAFVGAMDQNFNWIWAQFFGGSGGDYCQALAIDNTDNIIIGGRTEDTASIGSQLVIVRSWYNLFLAKLDKAGNFQTVIVGENGLDTLNKNVSAMVDKITINKNNELLVTGYWGGSDFFKINGYNLTKVPKLHSRFLCRMDASLNPQWGSSDPVPDLWIAWESRQFALTTKHITEAYATGAMGSSKSKILSYNYTGDTLSKDDTHGSSGSPYVNTRNYLLGTINDDLFTASAVQFYDQNGDNRVQHICRYSPGKYEPMVSVHGNIGMSQIAKTSTNALYLFGTVYDTAYVGQTLLTTTEPHGNFVVAKLAMNYLEVGLDTRAGDVFVVNVFPNPACDYVHVQSKMPVDKLLMVKIVDMNANLVLGELPLAATRNLIPIGHLAAGTYFIKVYNKDFCEIKKLVVK